MESCIAAERALVAAVVLRDVDPSELVGRLTSADFADPAAAALFEQAQSHPGRRLEVELPGLLRRHGLLRSDGYPISRLLEWIPAVPSPAQPQAWVALVVAGSLARQVQACGVRLEQAADSAAATDRGAGRVLAVAAAQRAALHTGLRRWDELPPRWRDAIAPSALRAVEPIRETSASPSGNGRDELVLAGLVAAPQLLDRLRWLHAEDFTDLACAQVFGALRQLHDAGRPVDRVTLLAAVEGHGGGVAQVCAALRPERAFPAEVPWLARRLVEDAVVRDAGTVGRELRRLGGNPAGVGGFGGPMLHAAQLQLDALQPRAERLLQARRGQSRAGPGRMPLHVARQPPAPARTRDDAGRHAG